MADPDELRTRINAETGRLAWDELQRPFARGVVIRVAAGLDLVEVATCFAADDREVVQGWLTSGAVSPAGSDEAQGWQDRQATFWAVVVAPWVLVQEIGSAGGEG